MTTSTGSFLLRPTPGTSLDPEKRRLMGGSPQRILTFSELGIELVATWFEGAPVGPDSAHRALARRLVEADLAIPSYDGPPPAAPAVDVIIPVRNDAAGLAGTLAALVGTVDRPTRTGSVVETATGIVRRIVIVDDGSEPAVDPAVGDGLVVPVTVVRRSTPAGPGNARNLALTRCEAPTIVFVDAGVIVTSAQLRTLAGELEVAETVAVAPRVRSEMLPGRLARYERNWSPLDLGSEGGIVGPGRRVPYVPSTCLAVRRSAVIDRGGFDPNLRYGEDVDLVWRLGAFGWVRYIPDIEVTHPPRSTIGGFVHQRFRYGTSAGPLARRHGWAVAPARLDSRSAATWAALLTGFRRTAALVAVSATAVYVAGLTRKGVSPIRVLRMVTNGWAGTARGLALSTARAWWPLAIIAAAGRRFRLAPLLLVLGWLRRLSRRKPDDQPHEVPDRPMDLVGDLALGVLDDSAYALGVWRGAVEARTVLPLLPDISIGRRRGAIGR